MDFLQRINNASWRQAFNVEAQRVQAMHDATFASVQQYVGDAEWVALLDRLDERANDGVRDAVCSTPDDERERCAAECCAYCRLSVASGKAAYERAAELQQTQLAQLPAGTAAPSTGCASSSASSQRARPT